MESYTTTTPQTSFETDSPLLEPARLLLEAGLSIVPATSNKCPALEEWRSYQTTLASDGDLEHWFNFVHHQRLGIVCGCVSGNLEVLDFDFQACAYEPWRELVEQEAPGLVDRLPLETSQRGGGHVPYRVAGVETIGEDGRVIGYAPPVPGNQAFARKLLTSEDGAEITYRGKPVSFKWNKGTGQHEAVITLIETRGEGGFIVCAPSPGYTMARGAWHEVPTITAAQRDILVSAARRLNEYIPPPKQEKTATTVKQRSDAAGLMPGADYNERGNVREVLIKEGWKLSHKNAANEYWTRPGKPSGVSASLRIADQLFYVFSSNAAPFTDGESYSPFAVYTLLKYKGDFIAAGKALYAAEYGERLTSDKQDTKQDSPTSSEPSAQATGERSHDPQTPRPAAWLENFPELSPVELIEQYPRMRPVQINGLLRVGEVLNLISASKAGKSWLVHALLWCVVTGQRWLDAFDIMRTGKVLLLDTELHKETLAYRIDHVARSLGINAADWADRFATRAVRGSGITLPDLLDLPNVYKPGELSLLVIDSFYKLIPPKFDENSNADMAQLFSMVDQLAARLDCSVVLVHHSTKGSQSARGVLDVGAGAGSMGRATDSHWVLREHAQEGVYVAEGRCRSFAQPAPRCLRWDFPLWRLADDCDPADLKPERRTPPRPPKEPKTTEAKEPEWNADRFAQAFLGPFPQPKSIILANADMRGVKERTARKLIDVCAAAELVFEWPSGDKRKPLLATVRPPLAREVSE